MKFANVTPVFNQSSINLKDNYRPISILPNSSKTFEKLISGQSNHFDYIFSKSKYGFRKGLSAQPRLRLTIDKWKKPVDNSKVFVQF